MKYSIPPNEIYGRYAGFVTRMMAFVIDLLIVTALLAILVEVLQLVSDALPLGRATETLLKLMMIAAAFVVQYTYYVGFWMLAGQTPGKRIMGLRVVRTDGKRLTLLAASIRWVAYWLSAILFLGFLWVIIDNRRQAWHDKLAGTMVVYAWPEEGLAGSAAMPVLDAMRKSRRQRRS